jgi:N-acetyl-gamma-glutamyl-phosphate/LysW-gamma-L-alpha-aminoadipyl-6-phosphate reductase
MKRATIIGASGYTGGELLRILLSHPKINIIQSTSRKNLGQYVYQVHPNLRKRTQLKFSDPQDLEPTDIIFLALPHGQAQRQIDQLSNCGEYIIDLSADFRLRDQVDYTRWYDKPHKAPEWLPKFIYGLPEINREKLKRANYVSGVGCNATASILALLPLVQGKLLDKQSAPIIEIKAGSSEGGASGNPGSHHPERSNVVRTFSPFGHRHTAEVIQELGIPNPVLTMTSVDLVRGVLATAHAKVNHGVTRKDLWRAYRQIALDNPFLRVVKERRGIYRVPEPKILAGSNYADLGFELDEENRHIVSICAIDNLMKGAAGSAVQCMNLMLGLDETTGLDFPGLHPI